MKILVTGAGFIGQAIVEHLAEAGHEVTVLVRRPIAISGVVVICRPLPESLIGVLPQADAIVHTAAVHPNSPHPPSIDEYVEVNVKGAACLAEFAIAAGVHSFINLSTVSLHGAVVEPVLRTETPSRHPGVYGASKLLAESVLREYAQAFPLVSLRLPGVVGPGLQEIWLKKTIDAAIRGDDIHVYNPDTPFNNIISAADLAVLTERILTRSWSGERVFPVGSRAPIPVRRAVELVTSAVGSKSNIIPSEERRSSFSIETAPLEKFLGTPLPETEATIRDFAAQYYSGQLAS